MKCLPCSQTETLHARVSFVPTSTTSLHFIFEPQSAVVLLDWISIEMSGKDKDLLTFAQNRRIKPAQVS